MTMLVSHLSRKTGAILSHGEDRIRKILGFFKIRTDITNNQTIDCINIDHEFLIDLTFTIEIKRTLVLQMNRHINLKRQSDTKMIV
jgi:hypothetical protein